ncbi:hypothetical protein BaRGS_00008286 [Batillaria attramentaria]|uniref:Uncharacterized protein n=1 Tax=Batillaria attramentaria TaxID=370345 RepID=A0ABD0LMZ7_9CAEN
MKKKDCLSITKQNVESVACEWDDQVRTFLTVMQICPEASISFICATSKTFAGSAYKANSTTFTCFCTKCSLWVCFCTNPAFFYVFLKSSDDAVRHLVKFTRICNPQ